MQLNALSQYFGAESVLSVFDDRRGDIDQVKLFGFGQSQNPIREVAGQDADFRTDRALGHVLKELVSALDHAAMFEMSFT